MNGVADLSFLPVAESRVAIFFFAGIIKHRFYSAEILRIFHTWLLSSRIHLA
jgi:hypothetical protein